jgi:hypothetical protein
MEEVNSLMRYCYENNEEPCFNPLCENKCYFEGKDEHQTPAASRVCPVTNATCHNPKCQIVTDTQDSCEFQNYPFVKGHKEEDWKRIGDVLTLPQIDEYVLWYTFDGNYFVECLDKDGNAWLKHCTHWRKLPAPPKA